MLVTGVAVLIGLGVGLALPPRPHRFARLTLRWLPLVAAGLVAQVAGSALDSGAGTVLLLGGYALLLAFALGNVHVPGTVVLSVGLALNALVIGVNGGMPVHPQSLLDARVVSPSSLPGLELAGHRHLEDADDVLTFLDDRIPLPAAAQVLSFGDLILAAGAADAVAHVARRRRRRMAHAAKPLPAPTAPSAAPRAPRPARRPSLQPAGSGVAAVRPIAAWRRARTAALARARLAHPAVNADVIVDLREWLPEDEDIASRIDHVRARVSSGRVTGGWMAEAGVD